MNAVLPPPRPAPAGLAPDPVGGRVAVERLTALWALAEVALGGALHALRLPFTGLFVGGSAVLLLTLIAHAAREGGLPVRRALLGATAVTLVLKAAASPHSPLGAYVAVGFQGLMAAALLPALGPRVGPFVLAVIALVESALQKALVLAVLFGAPLWEAVDALGESAVRAFGAEPGGAGRLSVWLVGGYVGLHVVAGVGVGVLAGRLPGHVARAQRSPEVARLTAAAGRATREREAERAIQQRPAWRRRPAVRRVLVVAAGLAVFAALHGRGTGGDGSAWTAAALSVARALTVLAVWTVAVAPALVAVLHRALGRRRGRYAGEVARATALLPRLRVLAPLAWREASVAGPLGRFGRFATLVTAAALVVAPAETGRAV
jgi:hypothetical protein